MSILSYHANYIQSQAIFENQIFSICGRQSYNKRPSPRVRKYKSTKHVIKYNHHFTSHICFRSQKEHDALCQNMTQKLFNSTYEISSISMFYLSSQDRLHAHVSTGSDGLTIIQSCSCHGSWILNFQQMTCGCPPVPESDLLPRSPSNS